MFDNATIMTIAYKIRIIGLLYELKQTLSICFDTQVFYPPPLQKRNKNSEIYIML